MVSAGVRRRVRQAAHAQTNALDHGTPDGKYGASEVIQKVYKLFILCHLMM
jgi:hypothetical protein